LEKVSEVGRLTLKEEVSISSKLHRKARSYYEAKKFPYNYHGRKIRSGFDENDLLRQNTREFWNGHEEYVSHYIDRKASTKRMQIWMK
jgi:hypothetical protein